MNNFAFLLNWRLRCNIVCGIGADTNSILLHHCAKLRINCISQGGVATDLDQFCDFTTEASYEKLLYDVITSPIDAP